MSTEHPAALRPRLRVVAGPPSDPRTVPAGKVYALALRFNGKRRGLAAFDWVAVWHGGAGPGSRAFPLEAHGFAEALRGAVATVLMETGLVVTPDELETAARKERRVKRFLREQALDEIDQKAELPLVAGQPGGGPPDALSARSATGRQASEQPASTTPP